jgi:hypothetical protein
MRSGLDFMQTGEPVRYKRRKIRLIEGNAKCRHLKILTHIRVYSIHRKGEGGRVEPERRGEGNSSQRWVENTNMTDCTSSL